MSQPERRITPEEAVDRYADMVYRLALLRVNNRADADDIFQEVFIRLVRHIDKLESWEHVKAWLIRVTNNCAKKHFNQFWNKNVSQMDETQEIQIEESGYSLAEGDGTVMSAVKSLPEKYRVAVHLFYFEELTVAQIAEVTEQKETTVKSHLHRAREMLKTMLKGEVIL